MKILLKDDFLFLAALSKWRKFIVVTIFCLVSFSGFSQKIALKTNALLWGTVSPNISAEFVVSHNMSLDLSASFNLWTPYSSIEANHLLIQPELRYWIRRPMSQHFVGFTLLYVDYDLRHRDTFYSGQTCGGGLTYGYVFVLSKRWNVEVTAGVGAMYKWQRRYNEGEAVPDSDNDFGWYVAPVKLGVSVSYVIF